MPASEEDNSRVDVFRCPQHPRELKLIGNTLICDICGAVGRESRGVWDFILDEDYAASFATQWKTFSGTQLDSINHTSISRRRFEEVTGWKPSDLAGLDVLDAGCGAGRFSEIAHSFGARVTSLDLSEAAYAAAENLAGKCTAARGDILNPPLADARFDRIFSIGVLQHTPNPERAAATLFRLVKPDGELAVWMYDRRWYMRLVPKYFLRTITTRLSQRRARQLAAYLVYIFTPLARLARHLPSRLARVYRACLPIASYWGLLPLDDRQQREWSLLDTQDWLTPRYDKPKTFEEMRAALVGAGASDVRRLAVPGLAFVATRNAADRPRAR